MSQIVLHMNPHVDVTQLEIEYELDGNLADLLQHLNSHNVERVEFHISDD